MKAFGIILLALLVGVLGYQYAYPKLDERLNFASLIAAAVNPQPEQPKRISAIDIPAPVIETPKIERPKEEPKPEPKPEPAPAPVVMAEPPKKEPSPDEFQPPSYPPIEEVVKNWQQIPRGAFPRPVKLLKDVEFTVVVNGNKLGSKIAAGGTVTAIEQDGAMIVISPMANSPARVQVALTDTDLKETLIAAYERWKPAMTDYLRRQWEFKRNAKTNAVASNTASKAGGRADKPERSADGTYPLLLASMKSGQVTEITPTNIKKWGDLNVEKIDGQEYYTVIVDYVTKTMFGDFPTSAQARIRDGKVVKWIYTGSGEVVP